MKMTPEIHCNCLGSLVANLQTLEFYIRAILSELPGAKPCGLVAGQNIFEAKVGDELLDCPMTSYASLAKLIEDFNKVAPEYKWKTIDLFWVAIRDALAHGRIAYAFDDKHDAFLMKFSRPVDGKVEVTFNEEMNYAWFQTKITKLAQIHSDLAEYSTYIETLKTE